jgi:hypothetical protein
MELKTQAIEDLVSAEELKAVEEYFKTNESGILNEPAEIDQHIALRPLAIIFNEQKEELQKRYQAMSFSKEAKEDGSEGIVVELVK